MVSDAQMQSQLERLPPGHPSSPWDAEGRRGHRRPGWRSWNCRCPGTGPARWTGAQPAKASKNDAADGTIEAVSHVIVLPVARGPGRRNPSSPARPPHFPGL